MNVPTKLPATLRELRIHMCQRSAGSSGLRNFVNNHYVALKTKNPAFPFLVREAGGAQAQIIGRFDTGFEKKIIVEGLNEAEVAAQFEEVLAAAAYASQRA